MTSEPSSLLLTLAGEPAVRVAGEWLALGRREAGLLAWLAVEGPTSRHELAGLLWPESDAEAARSALRQRLFKLRRLSGAALVLGTQTLALAPGVGHDLREAEGVLGERDLDLGSRFDGWLSRQRASRRDRVRQTLVDRSERAMAAREKSEAIDHARRLVALDPFSEDAHRRLMRLHYLAGERPAALLAFDACESLLKNEVGVAPSAETMTLLQTILQADAVHAGERLALSRPDTPAAVLRPTQRVGREQAWAALAGALKRCQVQLLLGEAGMGKSRLLLDLVQASESDRAVMVMAVARPGDVGVTYALATRLLRALAARFEIAPNEEDRALLSRLLPELGHAGATVRGDRDSLASAVHALLVAAAAQGLVAVVVDDLQFADEASVELFGPLVAAPACSWILAMRSDELAPSPRAWIDALQGAADTVTTVLEPLTPLDVAEILDGLSLPALGRTAGESLHRHTGGNPMYVLETVKLWLGTDRPAGRADDGETVWPGAANVLRLIQKRLRRLSPLPLRIVRCAAVAGQDSDARLIAWVLGVQPLDLADAWQELEGAHVFRDGRFVHDLVAEAALALVPEAIAGSLRGQVAQWLQEHAGEPARIADHWLAAREPLHAAPALVAAAELAMAAWRYDEAAARFEQAATIYLQAGDAHAAFMARFHGTNALSFNALDRHLGDVAAALFAIAQDDGERAMAALPAVASLIGQGRVDEACHLGERAMREAERAGLPEIEAEHLWGLAFIHYRRREIPETVTCAERLLQLLKTVPVEQRLLKANMTEHKASHALGMCLCATGRYEEGEARLTEALSFSTRHRDPASIRDDCRSLAGVALDRGDLGRALDMSAMALTFIERSGRGVHQTSGTLACRAKNLVVAGDLGGALDLYEQVERMFGDGADVSVLALVGLGWLRDHLGRRDLAAKGLRAVRDRSGHTVPVEDLHVEAALLSIGEAGDPTSAIERAGALPHLADRVGILCRVAARCEPELVLPLLNMNLTTTRDHGAHGLWLALQVRRAATLHAAGRAGEAAEAAATAWQRIEGGLRGEDTVVDMAALLCPALAVALPAQAVAVARQADAWMQAAAATLPASWRENYLARAPALSGLRFGRPRLGAA